MTDYFRPGSPASLAVVAAGGFLGGAARYAILAIWPESAGSVTWTTLAINLVGAFVLPALVLTVMALPRTPAWVRPAFGTGFLGAFTTFSALAVAVERRVTQGAAAAGWWTLALSVTLGLLAGLAGYATGDALARRIDRRRDAA